MSITFKTFARNKPPNRHWPQSHDFVELEIRFVRIIFLLPLRNDQMKTSLKHAARVFSGCYPQIKMSIYTTQVIPEKQTVAHLVKKFPNLNGVTTFTRPALTHYKATPKTHFNIITPSTAAGCQVVSSHHTRAARLAHLSTLNFIAPITSGPLQFRQPRPTGLSALNKSM